MITLVQRVTSAEVTVDGIGVGRIDHGLLLFVGVERSDGEADADETARKVENLRVFADRTPTDRNVRDAGGGCLVVSQFTLAAELRHGNRPDFSAAAPPELAEALYLRVAERLRLTGLPVATGRFGATMQVAARNDGPFSLVLTVRNGKVVSRPATPAGES